MDYNLHKCPWGTHAQHSVTAGVATAAAKNNPGGWQGLPDNTTPIIARVYDYTLGFTQS